MMRSVACAHSRSGVLAQVATAVRLSFENSSSLPRGKKKRRGDTGETPRKKKLEAAAREAPKKRRKSPHAKASAKSSPSTTPARKRAAPKKETPPPPKADVKQGDDVSQSSPSKTLESPPPPMNAHRVKILVGKEALAAIEAGTRETKKSRMCRGRGFANQYLCRQPLSPDIAPYARWCLFDWLDVRHEVVLQVARQCTARCTGLPNRAAVPHKLP